MSLEIKYSMNQVALILFIILGMGGAQANAQSNDLLPPSPSQLEKFLSGCRLEKPGKAPEIRPEIQVERKITELSSATADGILLQIAPSPALQEIYWSVEGPIGPHLQRIEKIVTGSNELHVKPNMPGEYIASVFIKINRGDGQNYCQALSSLGRFGVTVNTPQALLNKKLVDTAPPQASSVTVAVLDSGVNQFHPQFKGRLLTLDGKQVGYDFAMGDSDPLDDNGHGTAVAGIVARAAPHATILPIKVMNALGETTSENLAKGISFAVTKGAEIIVLSLSSAGAKFRDRIRIVLEDEKYKDILFVVAAGNGHLDLGVSPVYPAAFEMENLLTVTALDEAGKLWEHSNFGSHSVHVAAPGTQSCPDFWPLQNSATTMSTGTSLSAPFVAGLCAKLKAENPSLSGASLKEAFLRTTQENPDLLPFVMSGRVVRSRK